MKVAASPRIYMGRYEKTASFKPPRIYILCDAPSFHVSLNFESQNAERGATTFFLYRPIYICGEAATFIPHFPEP